MATRDDRDLVSGNTCALGLAANPLRPSHFSRIHSGVGATKPYLLSSYSPCPKPQLFIDKSLSIKKDPYLLYFSW